jgi:hypothetical protein
MLRSPDRPGSGASIAEEVSGSARSGVGCPEGGRGRRAAFGLAENLPIKICCR